MRLSMCWVVALMSMRRLSAFASVFAVCRSDGRCIPFVGWGVRGSSPASTQAGNSSRVFGLLCDATKGVK